MDEFWKNIEGYEGKYQISSFGRIRGFRKNWKIMNQWVNWNKYHLVTFHQKGIKRHFTVHSLVLKTFISPRPNGMEAAHLDNNRSNNRCDNLIWCTRKENHSHKRIHGTQQHGEANGNARFKEKDILKMRRLFNKNISQSEIARLFKTRQSYIWAVVNKKIWKHI